MAPPFILIPQRTLLLTRGVVNLLKDIHFNIPNLNLNGIEFKLNSELCKKIDGENIFSKI